MASWFQALSQSHSKNRILDHSNLLTLCTLIDSHPSMSPVRFQSFLPDSFSVFLDRRGQVHSSLFSGPHEFLWHFPLTSEFFKFRGRVAEETNDEVRTRAWNSLSQREKNGFCGLPPDLVVGETQVQEIDKFKPQEALNVSDNFVVLVVEPDWVEHARFLDKTAIGNTRKTFESLPQPDAVSKKWLHRKAGSGWEVVEMFVPVARP